MRKKCSTDKRFIYIEVTSLIQKPYFNDLKMGLGSGSEIEMRIEITEYVAGLILGGGGGGGGGRGAGASPEDFGRFVNPF